MYSDLLLDRNATVYKVQIYIFAPAPELIMGVCSLAALELRMTFLLPWKSLEKCSGPYPTLPTNL